MNAGQLAAKLGNGVRVMAMHRNVLVLLCLVALEIITFGRSIRQVGFYLDDWSMLNRLSSGPQQLFAMMHNYFLQDPKVTIRPVQVIYQAILFSIFQLNPLGYHLFNATLEVICATLLYFCLKRISGSAGLGYVAAALFLVYPVHDSSHYWVLCHAVNLSLALYLGSLWFAIKWAERGCKKFLLAMFVCFAVSIFNYETMLPLSALTAVAVWSVSGSKQKSAFAFLLHAFAVAALVVYQRKLVPMFGLAWYHKAEFDPLLMFRTVSEGFALTSPPSVVSFSLIQSAKVLNELRLADYLALTAVAAITALGVLITTARIDERQIRGGKMVGIGVLVILAAFSIFGLNSEYAPTLVTLVNRINTGAAIGWAIIAASAVVFTTTKAPRWRPVVAAVAGLSAAFFATTDWSMAQPWVVSWKMQHRIMQIAQANSPQFAAKRPVLLLNCPRYVMWAPVFDGVWDFQSMLQLATKNDSLQGNVVSERLKVTPTGLADMSGGYECGRYSFDQLQVLEPPHGDLITVTSAEQFVALVEPTCGRFGPSKEVLQEWRQSLISTKPRGGVLQ